MNLLPGERILSESEPVALTLTNYRIRQHLGQSSNGERCRAVKSILLRHVTSCRIEHVEQPVLILFGLLFLVGAAVVGANAPPEVRWSAALVALIGVLFFVAYARSRQFEMRIASPSMTLHVAATRASYSQVCEFVDLVEEAATLALERDALLR